MFVDDDLVRQLAHLSACRMTQVLGIEEAFQEYDFVLVGFALLFQHLGQPDYVLAHDLSFLVSHDGAFPNEQLARHQRGHHL